MPARQIYVSSSDVPQLGRVLRDLGCLALLETENGQEWRANRDFHLAGDGRWPFWCFLGGPLMRLPKDPLADPSEEIEDPYGGWFHERGTKHEPYFGNQTNILYLNINTMPRTEGSQLGLSSIEWIGNYFWALDRSASSSMKAAWQRIGKALGAATTKVPRGGLGSVDRKMVCAFPGALGILSAENVLADAHSR